MKEQAIKKINKLGKISGVLALIGKILVGTGLAVMLIATIACFAIPKEAVLFGVGGTASIDVNLDTLNSPLTEDDVKEMENEMEKVKEEGMETGEYNLTDVSISNERLYMNAMTKEKQVSVRDLGWMLLAFTGALVLTMVTLCFISSLCKAFRNCESPFEANVIRKMSNFAWSLIPWAFVSTITESLRDSFMTNRPSVALSIDLGMILVVLVIFALVQIFKYGAVLQQESDETL